jgi:NitT/TauT family transport system ATP-binding protein
MSQITFDNVSRAFTHGHEDFLALDQVSFEVAEKEFVAIVGPSGCGKTTLLRMAAGLEFPTDGAVNVGGHEVTGPGPDRAVVFQQFALFPWKTVRQNIGFGLKCKGVASAARENIVARYVQLMGLQGYEQAFPHQLSGGMQQRVAIARSYALDPDVLLMDEPFGALDAQTREAMQAELLDIHARTKKTILFVTHDLDEAVLIADRIVVMREGRVCEILDVPLPRPRTDLSVTRGLPQFAETRYRIWRLLHDAPTVH